MNIESKLFEIEKALRGYADKIIDDCNKDIEITHDGIKETVKLLLPSGDLKYKAFWVRDCAMICESHLVDTKYMKYYIDFFARYGQNGDKIFTCTNGRWVQPWAVTDHVSYRCKPTFFPGTYLDDETQGNEAYGLIPPLCDAYYLVTLVKDYIEMSGDSQILFNEYDGLTLLEKLKKGFWSNPAREDTELSYSKDEAFSIDWGFTDSVYKSGDLLFSSILRWRAAKAISEFEKIAENAEESQKYAKIAKTIEQNIVPTFLDKETGWLYSATEHCHQHDVWGTAFAVESGILDEQTEKVCCKAIYDSYIKGNSTMNGYVRHILTDEDWSKDTAWERPFAVLGYYQNGGYWATPTGWYATALYRHDKEACIKFLQEFLAFTEERGGEIYEWFNVDLNIYDGVNYGTSIALPYLSVKNLLK